MKKIDIDRVAVTTAILFIICIVVTAALAGTNFITKDRIAALEKQAEKEAMALILPAEGYTESKVNIDGQEHSYYTAVNGSETLGYLIRASENGYGGEVRVIVGVDTKGTVTGVKILAADDETPGLGAKIKNKSFYQQYTGKTSNVIIKKNQADSSNNEITAVTGATVSSTAVNNAVNKALKIADTVIAVQETENTEKEGE